MILLFLPLRAACWPFQHRAGLWASADSRFLPSPDTWVTARAP